jgi:phosphate transport system permease protein
MSSPDLTPSANVLSWRRIKGYLFVGYAILSLVLGLGMLVWLFLQVLADGLPWLRLEFFTNSDSRFADKAGIQVALVGTVLLMVITILVSMVIGIMAAIYLEEYSQRSRLGRLIEVNINNLAAVPSIIYGLLGLTVFVRAFGYGRSILAGGLTLALLVLPIVIVASREAIRAVPQTMREASYGLGATKWQTIWNHVLPYALSGIMTGNILAASRAIGETAPLITIGALTFVPFLPRDLLDRFTVLPIIIFNWTSKPQEEFHSIAAAAIIVLLAILLLLNSVAVFLRIRLKKTY